MSIYTKLHLLQQSVSLVKDKEVSYATKRGNMDYAYTTLPGYWDAVKAFFNEHNMLIYWYDIPHPMDTDCMILVTRIMDLEDDSYIESKVPMRLAPTDFRLNGATNSYWRRMSAIALCGLVDDEDPETFGMDGAKTAPASRTSKRSAPLADNEVIY